MGQDGTTRNFSRTSWLAENEGKGEGEVVKRRGGRIVSVGGLVGGLPLAQRGLRQRRCAGGVVGKKDTGEVGAAGIVRGGKIGLRFWGRFHGDQREKKQGKPVKRAGGR